MLTWSELRARLEDPDPEVRSAVAVAIGELWKSDKDAFPTTSEQDIALIEKLCSEYGQSDLALPLATRYGVLRPEFLAKCVEVDVDGAPGHLVTQTYGARLQWTVQWLFFRTTPFMIPRAREEGAAILSRLRAWALLPGDVETKLDRKEIGHVAFPAMPGTTRRSFSPRQDLQLDIAVRTGTSEIVALRVVRAWRGIASIHPIGSKKAANK